MAINFGMMNPMMMGGMNPMMGGMGCGNPMMMQMMQMMAMMQMMMGQMQGAMNPMMMGGMGQMGCPMGMPMGDMMGGFNGMRPNFSQPMMMPGYMPQPFMNQSPWGGGFPSQQPPYGSQGPWCNAPMAAPTDFRGGSAFGNALARNSANVCRTMGTSGMCYRGVKNALRPMGVNLHGGSAYMAADQLAGNPKFREIQVPRDQLRNLPPGAVVVWNRGPGHPHGHISVSLGNGMEGSDKLRRQITNYPSTCRVFIPNQGQ